MFEEILVGFDVSIIPAVFAPKGIFRYGVHVLRILGRNIVLAASLEH